MAEPKDLKPSGSPDSAFEIPLADAPSDTTVPKHHPTPDSDSEIPLADADDAPVKKKAAPPGAPLAPLPRLWKAEPEADEAEVRARPSSRKKGPEPEPAPPPKAKKRKAAADPRRQPAKEAKGADGEGGEKGVLVEETPNLDTYETRQRIRIAVGAGAAALLCFVGWMIYRTFAPQPTPAEASTSDLLAAMAKQSAGTSHDEQEARILFDRARDVAKNGKADVALSLLKTITTRYANTRTALQAREALDRPRKGLPIFLDSPAVVASPAAKPPTPAAPTPPKAVVDATKTNVAVASNARANLVPPANPPEPPTANPSPPLMPTVPVPVPSPGRERPSRPLPRGFAARPGSEVLSSGWPSEIVGDRDGAPMVFVAGGTFLQGRDDTDPAEAPAHKVTLGSYYVDRHEVTVRQFNLYQKEAGKRPDRARAFGRDPSLAALDAEDDLPVVMVTAREASDFCKWAGKRLPTEAQWEAAARTPDGRLYPWGPDPTPGLRPRDLKRIRPAMTNPDDLSPYGVFDLAGNALEWTKDWFDPHYYLLFRTATPDNPTGPSTPPRSQQLVVKGGAKDWVVSRREGVRATTRLVNLGFRGVLQVEGAGNAFEPPPSAKAPGQPAAPGGAAGGAAAVPF